MELPFKADQFVQKITVQSAVNPSLWACVVISIPLFILSSKTSGWFSIVGFITALLLILVFIFSYIYLLFKNPEYLRSEGYQLKMNTMRLLGDKDNPLQANAGDIVSVMSNPKLPAPRKQQHD